MGFEFAPASTGFDISYVLSDEKHFSSFVCGICTNLVSLDAVVTSECSHPFCRKCLESWALECNSRDVECTCPLCKRDISSDPSADAMEVGNVSVAARPLEEAQPLAFRVLSLVQVQCNDHDGNCKWTGDYKEYMQHRATLPIAGEDHVCLVPSRHAMDHEKVNVRRTKSLDKDEHRRTRCDEAPETPRRSISSGQELLEAREFLAATMERYMEEDEEDDENDPASATNEEHQDEDDGVVEQKSKDGFLGNSSRVSPVSSIPIISNIRGDTPPNLIKRQPSGIPRSTRPAESDRDDFRSDAEKVDDLTYSSSEGNSYIPQMKKNNWSLSGNSLGLWEEFEETDTTGREEEDDVMDDETDVLHALQAEPEDEETLSSPEVKTKVIVDRTEKLKKQANAKFNKGDFPAARDLYTEGINVMNSYVPAQHAEKMLMAHMHSNRSVTFFREKDFHACIADCRKALEFDPTYDKSWIRLWRAHLARGDFSAGHEVLEEASRILPGSPKIEEELKKSCQEKILLTNCKNLIDQGVFLKAKEILDEATQNSSNINLIALAAKADAGLGLVESCLEHASKALRLNPKFVEGVEMQGLAYFLMGETEKGAHILYDAYRLNSNSVAIKSSLTKCQKTHAALSAARSAFKKGRFDEAVDNFTVAIEECNQIPKKSPLNILLHIERADALYEDGKYLESLKDIQDVFAVSQDNVSAWVIRANVLVALGKPQEAKKEIGKIRSKWGAGDPKIEETYKRVDFEVRVKKEEEDLLNFVRDLETGFSQKLAFGGFSSDLTVSRTRIDTRPVKNRIEKIMLENRFDGDDSESGSLPSQSKVSVDSRLSKKNETDLRLRSARKPTQDGSESSSKDSKDRRPKRRPTDEGITIASDHRPRFHKGQDDNASVEGDRGLRSRKPVEDGPSHRKSRPRPRQREDTDDATNTRQKSRPRGRRDEDDDAMTVRRKSRPRERPRDDEDEAPNTRHKSRQRDRPRDDVDDVATGRRKSRPRDRQMSEEEYLHLRGGKSRPRQKQDEELFSKDVGRIRPRKISEDFSNSNENGERRLRRESIGVGTTGRSKLVSGTGGLSTTRIRRASIAGNPIVKNPGHDEERRIGGSNDDRNIFMGRPTPPPASKRVIY